MSNNGEILEQHEESAFWLEDCKAVYRHDMSNHEGDNVPRMYVLQIWLENRCPRGCEWWTNLMWV
jgi:hypothetical protein